MTKRSATKAKIKRIRCKHATVCVPACKRACWHDAPSMPIHAAANCGMGSDGRMVSDGVEKMPDTLVIGFEAVLCCDTPHQLSL